MDKKNVEIDPKDVAKKLKEQYEPVASTAREDFKVKDAEDIISTTLTETHL